MNDVHDLVCFDKTGKPLTHLTQWDINQTLIIHNSGLSYPPQFHFANKKSKSALVVKATLANGVLTCDIPNSLLREPYDIIVYMYTYNNTSSGKTIFIHRIPVIKRVRPDDYEYVDNKAVVSLINMMDLVKDLKSQIESKILEADDHLQAFDSYKNATDNEITSAKSRLSTAESNITALQGQISLKVEQTDIDSAMDSIEIGGRNLILQSATKKLTSYAGANLNFETGISVGEWKATDSIRVHGTGGTNTTVAILTTGKVFLSQDGENYTHSIYIKNQGSSVIRISNNSLSNPLGRNSKNVAPGETLRVILHGLGNGVYNLQINFLTLTAGESFDFIYWHPKIETGTRATDWTPAPEDIEESINQIKNSVVTTSANGLMSAADKSKLDGIASSADSVSFSKSLTSGTKVGTITINGTGTDLYAPTNTDTHYTTGLKVGASSTAVENAAATNGTVYLNVLDNTSVRDSHKIIGSGGTIVTSDANGDITISSPSTGGSASSLENALSITLNGGTTENTNKFTFDGSSDKSVNITPASIGAAASSHGRHVPDVCETITDWNNATKNGWFMGNGAINAPTASVWYFGKVIAHNANYVFQEVFQFNASTDAKAIPRYIRAKMNGTWGAWTNASVHDHTSISGTAAKLACAGNVSRPMVFNWSGQTGQPTWVWGGSTEANQYVYNPSNFNVNSAKLLTLKGTNTIKNDTTGWDIVGNWAAQGNSVHYYNTKHLTNQPAQYGFLQNFVNGSDVHQIWLTQATGNLSHRGGNSAGWSGTWMTILDSVNFPSITGANYAIGTDWKAVTPYAGDSVTALGTAANKWNRVYAKDGAIQTSDEREKDILSEITDPYEEVFMDLKPILYKWKNFGNELRPHDRIHCGLGAQTTYDTVQKYGLDFTSFAAMCKDDFEEPMEDGRTDRWGIAYEELIPLNIHMTQKALNKISGHDNLIEQLQSKLQEALDIIKVQGQLIAELQESAD